MPDFSTVNLDTFYAELESQLLLEKIRSVLVVIARTALSAPEPSDPAERKKHTERRAKLPYILVSRDRVAVKIRPQVATHPSISTLRSLVEKPGAELSPQERNTLGNALYDVLLELIDKMEITTRAGSSSAAATLPTPTTFGQLSTLEVAEAPQG